MNTSPLINTSKINVLQETFIQRVKKLSDSSLTSVQQLISSTNEPNRSQSLLEQISPTNTNGINRNIRK